MVKGLSFLLIQTKFGKVAYRESNTKICFNAESLWELHNHLN